MNDFDQDSWDKKLMNASSYEEWERINKEMEAAWEQYDKDVQEDFEKNPHKYTSYQDSNGRWYRLDKDGNRVYRDKEKEQAYEDELRRKQFGRYTPPKRLIDKAHKFYNANKSKPNRNYGVNWLRVLVAFGADDTPGVDPYTAKEARKSQKVWNGWKEFADALEKLEKESKDE